MAKTLFPIGEILS